MIIGQSRINCRVNFPARSLGHPAADFVCFGSSFCFSLRETGWGASACTDHLSWDSGQRRMKGRRRGNKVGEVRIQGEQRGQSSVAVSPAGMIAEHKVLVYDC